MAKKKASTSKKKQETKCPEHFNSAIDFAGASAMGMIADSQERKHQYSKRGKVNPYAVTGARKAMELINSREDVVKTGIGLTMIGSFDDDDETPARSSHRSWQPPTEEEEYDNWILRYKNNPENEEYGVYPEEWLKEEYYLEALEEAKHPFWDERWIEVKDLGSM